MWPALESETDLRLPVRKSSCLLPANAVRTYPETDWVSEPGDRWSAGRGRTRFGPPAADSSDAVFPSVG